MRASNNIDGRINFYASCVEVAERARPLPVLRAIDDMENYLSEVISGFTACIEYGEWVIDEIASIPEVISEDSLPRIENGQEQLRELYEYFTQTDLDASAWCDKNDHLRKDLAKAKEVTKGLFDQQEALKWAILEHNVDAGPKGEPLVVNNVDDLRKALSFL
ncbi:hypothetical protein [Symbiopectobacterium purcellii]|uniref:Uncharacterized protein n=1 Tax=Symbiopectobacterium purcellii TaxID=2871826 RepID=A0ABX9AUV3_9ENTR|nr:hypothetical protein [Symbiopectobacterium purcellii]QZN97776.1 hypothetical protein K6K13_11010 [Symbiopectobacterium purcellii]